MFMEEKDYKLVTNKMYQDNQSTIKMATNGRNSCTGNSRHIHIRYFFYIVIAFLGGIVVAHIFKPLLVFQHAP